MSEIPRPGELIAGKFRVERVLGQGGMGVVVSARHTELGESFAIKLVFGAQGGQGAVERFRREARAAARLRGEHVARVSDFGALENGTPYLVMEYVHGPTLGRLLKTQGPLPAPRVAGYLLDACAGLAEAHALGIVHRDVKPANLIVSSRPDGSPCVKVLDFGIAKTSAGNAPSLTMTSSALGSPAYMSPEQIRDARQVDARADVWSLGVVFYEAVTGRLPFEAFTASGLLAVILDDPPTPPSQFVPDLAPEVEALILACLDKDRDRRPASVGALAARLGPIAGRDGVWVGKILERPELVVTADHAAPPLLDNNLTEAPSTLTRDPAPSLDTSRAEATAPPRATPSRRAPLLVAGAVAALVLTGAYVRVSALHQPATAVPSAAPLPSGAAPATAPPGSATAPAIEPSAPPSLAAAPSPLAAAPPSLAAAPPPLTAAPLAPAVSAATARPTAPRAAGSAPRPSPPTPPATRPAPASGGSDIAGFGGRL